ncbi:filamentous hemagglutinin N-terminal domain-containing protein [Helicobacter aurati]|uniref:Filamentous hemagglutinin N-terminal domain-containing protein n=1 Tax=Helicobacter aurati TaxID=137778 RepID=A0A3D8IZD1_9HELI|nr:hemagglutinin repeat-containing protein [Helicobacter aurati]RDU70627.1 filamentous hemagglutinin N-terminal domain-containing protein [Helicobacter aurati]
MSIVKPFVKKALVTNVLSIVLSQSLLANEIIIDTTRTQNNPHLTHSQNNIDIVNIAKPSQVGISNNFYQEFNVAQEGLILNNILSKEVLANTNLAGFIYSNPNLDRATAKLILNQVTGDNISKLLGYIEIAGNKADMLLANPNGITCKNCGFINAGNISLATGALSKEELDRLNSLREYNENTQISLNIRQGQILVEALDAKNVASLTLLAKNMKVKDSLQAQNLRILLGSNQISFSPITLLYRPIKLNDEEKSEALALDVAYLGSVLSNKIFIVATDEGVGIKNSGVIASSVSQHSGDNGFILKANGKIEISKPIEITTRAGILKVSADELDPTTSQSTKIAPMLYSESSINMEAKNIENHSIIHAKEDIAIVADSVLSKGSADIEKRVISKEKFESWHPTINSAFGTHGGTDKVHTTYTYDIVNYDEYINKNTYSPSMILGKNIRVEANDFINDTGIIYASQSFDNNAANFSNISPTLRNITSYENGSKTIYNRYGSCTPILWRSNPDMFCGSTYDTSSFTRASQYGLLDFTAPSIDYSLIEDNSYNAVSLALDSIKFQPDTYQGDYQSFIASDGFKRHLKNAGLQFVSNNTTQATYIAPINTLKQNNDYMGFRLPAQSNINNASLKVGVLANSININSTHVFNSSSISSDKNMMINADFIINDNGKLVSTEGLDLNANTFRQSGGAINAKSIAIYANTVNMQSSTLSNSAKRVKQIKELFKKVLNIDDIDSTSSNTTLGSMANISGDNISIFSNKSNISGVNINAKNDTIIKSDSLRIDTIETNDKYSDLVATHEDTKQITTSISGRNISLQASNNINLVSADIRAQDSLAIESNGDISIDTAQNTNKSKIEEIDTIAKFFSSTTTTETTRVFKATNIDSSFSASNIAINAANNLTAYNLNSNADTINMNANNNIALSNKANSYNKIIDTKIETSGLRFESNKGFYGISIGKDTTKTNQSNLANIHNNASLNANSITMNSKDIIIESSDLKAKDSIILNANNVDIKSLDNEYKSTITKEFQSNRFSIGVRSKEVNDLSTNILMKKPTKWALNKIPANFTQKLATKINLAKIDSFGFKVGFTHKNNKSIDYSFGAFASSSNITSDNITINSLNDTNILGSNLSSRNIALIGENINIKAAKELNITSKSENNNTIDVSLDFSIGKKENTAGLSLGGSYTNNKTESSSKNIAHKGSSIKADNLIIQAKDSTNIIGSNIDSKEASINTTSFNLKSAENTSESSSNKKDISVGAKLTYNGSYGIDANVSNNQTNKKTESKSNLASNFHANDFILNASNNTNIIGSNLNANNASINTNNLNLLASSDTNKIYSNSFGASFSASFSKNVLNNNFSFDVNNGLNNLSSNTYNNAKLNANNLNLNINNNLNLTGGNIESKSLNANIANDVNIASLQDSESRFNVNAGISKSSNFSGDLSFGYYKNANLQSGINTDTINMNVGSNIALRGAYIDSDNGNINADSISHSTLSNSSSYSQISSDVFKSKLPGIGLDSGYTLSSISHNIALNANSDVLRSNSINKQVKNQAEIIQKRMDIINKAVFAPKSLVKDYIIKDELDSIKGFVNKPIDNMANSLNKNIKVGIIKTGINSLSNSAKKSINNAIDSSVDKTLLKPLDVSIAETISNRIQAAENNKR